jgi:hypothetical protein
MAGTTVSAKARRFRHWSLVMGSSDERGGKGEALEAYRAEAIFLASERQAVKWTR